MKPYRTVKSNTERETPAKKTNTKCSMENCVFMTFIEPFNSSKIPEVKMSLESAGFLVDNSKFLFLYTWPVPQGTVQLDHWVQSPHEQYSMTPHSCSLQARVSDAAFLSQKAPPFLAMTVICLKRICWPPPQALEQAPQAFHLCSQSTGHGWVLQLVAWE